MSTGPLTQVTLRSASGERLFRVELAITLESKERGFMHRRDPLGPDEGMLFPFDRPDLASFWMKNTFIPLDLAYFDASGRLVAVHHMSVEPDPANPKTAYHSGVAVKFALETAFDSLSGLDPLDDWRLEIAEPARRAIAQAGL